MTGTIFWARSKQKIGYEPMFHAYRKPGREEVLYANRLCEGDTSRLKIKLLEGNPRIKYQCEECREHAADIVKKRIGGNNE